ncbi:MAG TPA: pyrrolo-quinoline quinone [Candidatus Binatia bacterium]|nr:pyrrolo-quinoline quinone [Candidatus Binatia bacterium]
MFSVSRFSLCILALCVLTAAPALSQSDILTYHHDNSRTGLNSSETILTTSNVNYNQFGKLFTVAADGLVDAQPLYLSQVSVAGQGTHNLLIVATENDSMYAFDADAGTPIWHVSTLLSGETPSDDRHCNQVTPTIGITATPVISRPPGSNGVIYAVAMSKDSSGNYHHRLHALDASTGKELYNGPKEIQAQYPGTGDGSQGGFVVFDPAQYKERAGLILINGMVMLTFSSHCDIRPYTGWIMGYNSSTLKQTTVLNITPNGSQGSIWGAGGGLASDNFGNLFFLDANGIFDTTLNSKGFPSQGDYGNAIVRLDLKKGLEVADYFEMYDGPNESADDTDLGSGGLIVLPEIQDTAGRGWYLAAGAGKDGNIYLVNRVSLGGYNPSKNNIYQELTSALGGGIFSSPAFYEKRLYYGPVNQPILAFQFENAKLSSTPVAQTATVFAYPGATPSISSNGLLNGIVWASENTNPAVLHAYSAGSLQELYNSTQAAHGRDNFGAGNKFISPVVINGKVYVGTTTGVGVFGLLDGK